MPPWLRTYGLYRLDVYYPDLGLAIEYNGKQHYKFVPFFHRNGPEDLEKQKERDALVDAVCGDNWVTVIVVPYTVKDVREFLRKELETLGYELHA
ncbi:MAG: hypothetical protein KGL39_09430 [Patescibacteria group bacterium]|nr:hypothetical protein [Patescibacteria group bacterium]